MNLKRCIIYLTLLFSSILLMTSTVFGAPKVTKVELDSTVHAGFYAVVFDKTSAEAGGCDGVWMNPGSASATHPSAGPDLTGIGGPDCSTATEAEMFGVSSGYGQLFLSVTAASNVATATELGNMGNSNPTNANTAIFGAAAAPVNKANIELGGANTGDRALDAGTEVTFTVDMNNEVPHLVAVMGGSAPTVTYDATGTGTLTIKSTTFGTTTNAGDTFYSLIGFMIFTDTTSFGNTPLRIIAQTNHWVGDIFPLLPGWDTNAAVTNGGGTQGSITAKCGTTINGPVGEERTINIFFPDGSIGAIFGSGVTNTSLATFANSTQESNATITREVTNFGTTGTLASFTYTFASAKDTSIGVDSTAPTVASTDPTDGETGVDITTTIKATFSEDMDDTTITTSTFTVASSDASIGGTVTYSDKVATFTPTLPLAPLTTYTATITTGAKDSAGNALAQDHAWSFTTLLTGGDGDIGCFIATATYGSPMQTSVKILRQFRDRFLLHNTIGKRAVDLYYTYSPPIAEYIAGHDGLRTIVRVSLLPFVGISWVALRIGPLYSVALVFLLVFSVAGLSGFRRKKFKK